MASPASTTVPTTFSQASAHSLGFCSTSSISSPFSGSTHIDRRGFLTSSFRVGGPSITSLPAVTGPPGPEYEYETMLKIEEYANRIFHNLRLPFHDIQLVGRRSMIDPEPRSIPTVLVKMPANSNPDLWYRAVRQVHDKLTQHGFPTISVEIIENQLFDGIYCSPVDRSHSIHSKWPNIVQEIVSRSDTSEWAGIDCWRYGTNTDRRLNPVTVIVRVEPASTNSFVTAARFIHGILALFKETDVDVLFVKDAPQSLARYPELHKDSVSGAVHPGVSMGINRSSAGSSTLGGLVQIRFGKDSKWLTCATTCFHCVYPPKIHQENRIFRSHAAEKALQRWINHPVSLKESPQFFRVAQDILRVDHPSVGDLVYMMKEKKGILQWLKSKEFLETKRDLERLERGEDVFITDNDRIRHETKLEAIRSIEPECAGYQQMLNTRSYYLGATIAGSGLNRAQRNDKNERIELDWALIEIDPKRIQPQTNEDLVSGNRPFPYGGSNTIRFSYRPDFMPRREDVLTKSGRSTHITRARYNELKSAKLVRLHSKDGEGFQRTIEWVHFVVPHERSVPEFAEEGDSGSWIYNAAGTAWAMLTGKDRRLNTTHVCLLKDIFKDIQVVTGASDVRVASGVRLVPSA